MRRTLVAVLVAGASFAPSVAFAGYPTMTAEGAYSVAEPVAYADAVAHNAPKIAGPKCSVRTRRWARCTYTFFYLRDVPGHVKNEECTRKLDVRYRTPRSVKAKVTRKYRLVCVRP